MTGIASLKTKSNFLKIGNALLSGISRSALNRSFMYLSQTILIYLTSIIIIFILFQSEAYFYKSVIPLKIFCFITKSCFIYRKVLKFVN